MSEKLDSWGRARIDSIRTYDQAANRYGRQGSLFKAFVADTASAAAELAPHSWKGVIFEVGTMAVGAGATKLGKVMKVGELFETAREARLAGKLLKLGRTMFEDRGYLGLAQSLGKRHGPRVLLSAVKASTHVAHAGGSLVHSVPQVIKYAPALAREIKSLPVRPAVSSLARPVAKRIVTHGMQKRGVATSFKPSFNPRPVASSIQPLHLRQRTLGQSMTHNRPGLHAPKLHISRALNATAKAMAITRPPSLPAQRMVLQQPRLGTSMGLNRPAFRPLIHRAPVRGFRR